MKEGGGRSGAGGGTALRALAGADDRGSRSVVVGRIGDPVGSFSTVDDM
jgi:hypothetical protein